MENELQRLTGQELRERRLALGLSQRKLAKIFGTGYQTICEWEKGKRNMRHPNLIDLALKYLEHEKE